MAEHTVYDSVFKTMMSKTPELIVPFINEAFGRDYVQSEPIVRFSDEHETMRGSIIDDTVFRLRDKIYHIECQSTKDTSMVVRMIEYDFAIALEQALSSGAPYEMDFPASCVLFLRHDQSTPDLLTIKVNLPNGEAFDYQTKVVKAQGYSADEILAKRLLILLPYYLMRYEDTLNKMGQDGAKASELIAECSHLRYVLESATLGEGNGLLYEQLIELIIKVSDHLLRANEDLQKRVRLTMGGEVLELMRERAERLEREAEARGIELGREQGLEQGLEQGREQGINELSARLKTSGVDPRLIERAVSALQSKQN